MTIVNAEPGLMTDIGFPELPRRGRPPTIQL